MLLLPRQLPSSAVVNRFGLRNSGDMRRVSPKTYRQPNSRGFTHAYVARIPARALLSGFCYVWQNSFHALSAIDERTGDRGLFLGGPF